MKTPVFASLIIAAALPAATAAMIYQDDFSGTAGTDLNGSIPDTRLAGEGGSSTATWTANTIIDFNGANGAALASEGNLSRSAYLPFTPQTNFLYDYRVSMAFAEVINTTRSMQMGFFGSPPPSVTTALTTNASQGPVIFFRNNGTYVARAVGNAAPPDFNGNVPAADVVNVHTFRITIDTSQEFWVMRTYFDGVEFGNGHTFATNPTIGGVGFAVNTSGTTATNAAGTFSDFRLTATAIPEPSVLALLSICSIFPLLRRRGKSR